MMDGVDNVLIESRFFRISPTSQRVDGCVKCRDLLEARYQVREQARIPHLQVEQMSVPRLGSALYPQRVTPFHSHPTESGFGEGFS
jgi:hypothetical protein